MSGHQDKTPAPAPDKGDNEPHKGDSEPHKVDEKVQEDAAKERAENEGYD